MQNKPVSPEILPEANPNRRPRVVIGSGGVVRIVDEQPAFPNRKLETPSPYTRVYTSEKGGVS